MIQDLKGAGLRAGKGSGNERADGVKSIRAIPGDLRRIEEKPGPDVKDNEPRYYRRITQNTRTDVFLHGNVRCKVEVLRTNEKSANDQSDDPNQHPGSEDIGHQVERAPHPASGMKGEKTLQHVNQID